MKFNYKTFKPEISALALILLLDVIIVYHWTQFKYLIVFWDDFFPFNPSYLLHTAPYVWVNWNGGVYSGAFDLSLIDAMYYAMQLIHLSLAQAQAVFTIVLLFGQFIFMYLFLKRFITKIIEQGDRNEKLIFLVSLVGASLYSYNLFQMLYSWTTYSLMPFTAVSLPLIGLATLHLTEGTKTRNYLSLSLSTLLLFLSSSLAFIGTPVMWYVILLFGLVTSFAFSKTLRTRIILPVYTFLIMIGSTLIYTIPLYLTTTTANSSFGATRDASIYQRLAQIRGGSSNIITVLSQTGMDQLREPLLSNNKFFAQLYPFVGPIGNAFLLLSILPFSVIVARSTFSRVKALYLFLIVVLIALSVVNIPILGRAYLDLFRLVPFLMQPLNEPWASWGLVYVFLFSTLSSTALLALWNVTIKNRFQKVLLRGITIGIVILSLTAVMVPFVSGAFIPSGYWNAKVDIPNTYVEASQFVSSQGGEYNVAILPLSETLTSTAWNQSYTGREILCYLISKPCIGFPTSQVSNSLLFMLGNLTSSNSFTKGSTLSGLLNLDESPAYTIPAALFNPDPKYHFVNSGYQFYTANGGEFNITFEGGLVGHVDVVVTTKNSTTADYNYSQQDKLSFLVNVPPNSYIQPRIWNDVPSSVSQIIISRANQTGRDEIIGYQLINALQLLGVRYVILRFDERYVPEIPSLAVNSSFVSEFFSSQLNERPNLFGNLSVYEIPNYLPTVYLLPAASEASLNESIATILSNTQPVSILENNPSQYIVNLKLNGSEVVVLSQNFDKEWIAYLITGSQRNELNNHFELAGFANAWLVNGTEQATLEFEYLPQQTFQDTLVIWMSLILSILAAICYFRIARIRSKKFVWSFRSKEMKRRIKDLVRP